MQLKVFLEIWLIKWGKTSKCKCKINIQMKKKKILICSMKSKFKNYLKANCKF